MKKKRQSTTAGEPTITNKEYDMINCGGKRKMMKGGKAKMDYKAGGGLMQVKKLYKAGGKVDMNTRGCGAATKGMMHSKKMG